MSATCDHCQKKTHTGHAVSHAKVRLQRLFKKNLQHVKMYKRGVLTRVRLCTSCIQRIRKYGALGVFQLKKKEIKLKITGLPTGMPKEQKKSSTSEKESLDIAAIVGKQA